MTIGTRRVLFYVFLLIFLFASYIAVLYAQGYKYSFKEKKFLHTGVISLKANEDAKVFLNDNLKGSTSFLGNSFGIDGLLPGSYDVSLRRENYSPWQKKIQVQEGIVTDFSRILILSQSDEDSVGISLEASRSFSQADSVLLKLKPTPTPSPSKAPVSTKKPNPTLTPSISVTPTPAFRDGEFVLQGANLFRQTDGLLEIFAKDVIGYDITENKRKILWWTENEIWVAWLQDTDYQPYYKQGDKEMITRFSSPITSAAWFRGEDHIVVDSLGYKVVEIDKRGGTNIIKI
jgi:hypothetical protein